MRVINESYVSIKKWINIFHNLNIIAIGLTINFYFGLKCKKLEFKIKFYN